MMSLIHCENDAGAQMAGFDPSYLPKKNSKKLLLSEVIALTLYLVQMNWFRTSLHHTRSGSFQNSAVAKPMSGQISMSL